MDDIMKYIMGEVDKISNDRIKDRLKEYFISQNYNLNEMHDYDSEDNLEIDLFQIIDKAIDIVFNYKYKDKIDSKYIGDITEFIKFYQIAIIIQKNGGSINLIEMAIEMFDTSKIKDLDEESMKAIDDWIKEDEDFKKFYNKLCRDFSNLERSKYFLSQAGIKISQKYNQYGRNIPKSNRQELLSLNKLWEGKTIIEKDIRKIYKKINFDNIESMRNIDYINFNDYFNNDIINSNEEYKNILFYKLERKYAQELRKCTFKNLNKIKDKRDKCKFVLLSEIYIASIPVLTIREDLSNKLLNIFIEQDDYTLDEFCTDIENINKFIRDILIKLKEMIGEEPIDKLISENNIKDFKKIYNLNNGKKSFENNYRIGKDYKAKDIECYNKIIKFINDKWNKNIIENIKNRKLK